MQFMTSGKRLVFIEFILISLDTEHVVKISHSLIMTPILISTQKERVTPPQHTHTHKQ